MMNVTVSLVTFLKMNMAVSLVTFLMINLTVSLVTFLKMNMSVRLKPTSSEMSDVNVCLNACEVVLIFCSPYQCTNKGSLALLLLTVR